MDVSKRQPQHKKSSGRPAQNAATPPQKMVSREPNPDHLDTNTECGKNQGENEHDDQEPELRNRNRTDRHHPAERRQGYRQLLRHYFPLPGFILPGLRRHRSQGPHLEGHERWQHQLPGQAQRQNPERWSRLLLRDRLTNPSVRRY